MLPHGAYAPRLLTRGQFVSIYGWNLGPRQWCGEERARQRPYPTEVCGVRVLVGGHPAGLMYVGQVGNRSVMADQINFQIPEDAPAEGMVSIQVCVAAICSEPVEKVTTARDIVLSLDGDAYVHMPVWIQVAIPMNPRFSYPNSYCPWDFDGYDFEIRRNGQVLTPATKPECFHNPKGRRFVSGPSSLPLHLAYRFDSPGTYEVRLTGPLLTPDLTKVARIGQSDWLQITVRPHSDEKRTAWLRSVAAQADRAAGWQSDLITSLLAWSDEEALATLICFLPPPPPAGRLPVGGVSTGLFNVVVHCIAPQALRAFPEPVLLKLIPAARLKQLRVADASCQ